MFVRTGRRFIHGAGPEVEVKFNGWHDAQDGRFTFVNGGNYFPPDGRQVGGGGSFGGGGATSKEKWPAEPSKPPRDRKDNTSRRAEKVSGVISRREGSASPHQKSPKARKVAKTAKPVRRHVRSNGYDYEIDEASHPFRVSGTLRTGSSQRRNRRAQAEAGGKDRLATDEGGHLIARRFDGPSDAFNHFPQDRNFNRSGYAKLENEMARLQREGKTVRVEASVIYKSGTWRPEFIDFKYSVEGVGKSQRFANAPEKRK